MAKVPFSKLSLKKDVSKIEICISNVKVEVKQYLPIDEKLALISRVVNQAHDPQYNYANPVKIEVISAIEVVMAYTNLSFTDKQKEDYGKLYDALDNDNVLNTIFSAIPEREYGFVMDGITETIDAVYKYQNSALGILDTIGQDYSNLELDAQKLQEKMNNPENLALLKDVLTKLG